MYAFEQERKALLRPFDEDLMELFKISNAIIAGGAITSIFSSKEINDYDIYFRSFEDIQTFISNAFGEDVPESLNAELPDFHLLCTSFTNRSIMFRALGELKIQLIHFKLFDEIQDIFDSFDFTINMGAFDFKTNEFVMDNRFLADVSKRRLVFNEKTTYPIISTLRVQKYVERGYTTSKKVMFQLALAVARLDIQSWKELEDQLSGFYGVNVKDLFDNTQEFDLTTAINMLDLVEEDINPVFEPQPVDYPNVMESVSKHHGIPVDIKYYKKVNYKNSVMNSVVYTDFTWNLFGVNNGGDKGIYAFRSYQRAVDYNYSGNAVIEVQPQEGATVTVGYHGEYVIHGDVRIVDMTMLDGATAPNMTPFQKGQDESIPVAPQPPAPFTKR